MGGEAKCRLGHSRLTRLVSPAALQRRPPAGAVRCGSRAHLRPRLPHRALYDLVGAAGAPEGSGGKTKTPKAAAQEGRRGESFGAGALVLPSLTAGERKCERVCDGAKALRGAGGRGRADAWRANARHAPPRGPRPPWPGAPPIANAPAAHALANARSGPRETGTGQKKRRRKNVSNETTLHATQFESSRAALPNERLGKEKSQALDFCSTVSSISLTKRCLARGNWLICSICFCRREGGPGLRPFFGAVAPIKSATGTRSTSAQR